jgi:hypothetical protein
MSPALWRSKLRNRRWYPVMVSNHRHPVCKTGALTAELTGYGRRGRTVAESRCLRDPAIPRRMRLRTAYEFGLVGVLHDVHWTSLVEPAAC